MNNILYVAKRGDLYIKANKKTTENISQAKFYKTYKALFRYNLHLRKINPAHVEYSAKNEKLYEVGVLSYNERIKVLGPWPTNYYLNELQDDVQIVKVLIMEVKKESKRINSAT